MSASEKLLAVANYLHDKGIPIPLIRDKDVGSLSATLVWLSFSIVAYAILKEKASDALMYAMGLFSVCGSMYFGKKWQMRKIGTLDIGGGEPDPETKVDKPEEPK